MKAETIFEALSHTPDQYIDGAHVAMESGKRRMGLRRTLLMAACIGLAAVMVALPIASFVNWLNDPLRALPTIEITPEMLEDVMGTIKNPAAQLGDSSNTITNVGTPFPDSAFLYANLPEEADYLPIYSAERKEYGLNKTEFQQFADTRIEKLTQLLDIPSENITPYSSENAEGLHTRVEGWTENPLYYRYTVSAGQDRYSNTIQINSHSRNYVLNGQRLSIDPNQSDEEIAASLEGIRQSLNEALGENFSDTVVRRVYSSYGTLGTGVTIYVYFCNIDDNPMNQWLDNVTPPYSDYVRIFYRNPPASAQADMSCSILYTQSRTPMEEQYQAIGKTKMLSVDEAREFGGVNGNYTYVTFTYLVSQAYQHGESNQSIAIPIYVFYRYNGVSEAGVPLYTFCRIPAVEVKDYKTIIDQIDPPITGVVAN